jgi:hypothetical protein
LRRALSWLHAVEIVNDGSGTVLFPARITISDKRHKIVIDCSGTYARLRSRRFI